MNRRGSSLPGKTNGSIAQAILHLPPNTLQ